MGQKVHPLGFRVGITKKHQSQWFARFNKYKYSQSILEDRMIRDTLSKLFPELLNTIHLTPRETLGSVRQLPAKQDISKGPISKGNLEGALAPNNAKQRLGISLSGSLQNSTGAISSRNKVEKKKREEEISILPRITQIKIERGLIPYEIGIQIHAENCELLKSSIDNLKVKRELIIKLQKTRRYLLNLKLKDALVPSSSFSRKMTSPSVERHTDGDSLPLEDYPTSFGPTVHSTPEGSEAREKKNCFGRGFTRVTPARSCGARTSFAATGPEGTLRPSSSKLVLFERGTPSPSSPLISEGSPRKGCLPPMVKKMDCRASGHLSNKERRGSYPGSPFKSRQSLAGRKLTKQEFRRQRLIKKRLKKRQFIRTRYRQLILKGLFLKKTVGTSNPSKTPRCLRQKKGFFRGQSSTFLPSCYAKNKMEINNENRRIGGDGNIYDGPARSNRSGATAPGLSHPDGPDVMYHPIEDRKKVLSATKIIQTLLLKTNKVFSPCPGFSRENQIRENSPNTLCSGSVAKLKRTKMVQKQDDLYNNFSEAEKKEGKGDGSIAAVLVTKKCKTFRSEAKQEKKNKKRFSSRIKKKFLTLYIQKMNKKFLSHLKILLMDPVLPLAQRFGETLKNETLGMGIDSTLLFDPLRGTPENREQNTSVLDNPEPQGVIRGCLPPEGRLPHSTGSGWGTGVRGSYAASFSSEASTRADSSRGSILAPLGYNTQWNLKRLNTLKFQPIYKLNRMIVVLEQKLLVKLESLRKEFIAFTPSDPEGDSSFLLSGLSSATLPQRGKTTVLRRFFSEATCSLRSRKEGTSTDVADKTKEKKENQKSNLTFTTGPELQSKNEPGATPCVCGSHVATAHADPENREQNTSVLDFPDPKGPPSGGKKGPFFLASQGVAPGSYRARWGGGVNRLGKILNFLKNLKELVNKLKREQKLQLSIISNPSFFYFTKPSGPVGTGCDSPGAIAPGRFLRAGGPDFSRQNDLKRSKDLKNKGPNRGVGPLSARLPLPPLTDFSGASPIVGSSPSGDIVFRGSKNSSCGFSFPRNGIKLSNENRDGKQCLLSERPYPGPVGTWQAGGDFFAPPNLFGGTALTFGENSEAIKKNQSIGWGRGSKKENLYSADVPSELQNTKIPPISEAIKEIKAPPTGTFSHHTGPNSIFLRFFFSKEDQVGNKARASETARRASVFYKKLNNIEDECRKQKLIEYIKDIVKKHRTENIYFYLSTIADARKSLRKIKLFTKHHADFLFGLPLRPGTVKTVKTAPFSSPMEGLPPYGGLHGGRSFPEDKQSPTKPWLQKQEAKNLYKREIKKDKINQRVNKVFEKASKKTIFEKTLQDIFLEQIEKQKTMCLQNLQLTPKISIRFYSVNKKTLEQKASIVSHSVVDALEKRKAFRKIIKDAKETLMRSPGVKGVKIQVAGRLNGAEIARTEWVRAGRVPLQTLRANLDYSYRTANTIYGIIGVRVWIFKGIRAKSPRSGKS